MKKPNRSGLQLKTETVRTLTPDALRAAAGGGMLANCPPLICKQEGTSSTADSRCCPSEYCVTVY